MSIADRSVTTTWEGPLASGSGTFGQGSSGALDGQTVTWASRTEAPAGKTSPEELAAAAHSSCYSMALSLKLGENKTPPQRLDVSATVSLEEVDGAPTITTSALTVRAQVEGLDEAAFAKIVDETSALCPVSRLFAGATITVDAALEAA
ncbi:MAG TPA: OsmC family peroxiredoxin [Ruania sp.]|nr:OsmC family peroxiredoxin [Ruania sp.]